MFDGRTDGQEFHFATNRCGPYRSVKVVFLESLAELIAEKVVRYDPFDVSPVYTA